MQLYLSHTSLESWSDTNMLDEGRRLFKTGCVNEVDPSDNMIEASITYRGRTVRTRIRLLENGHVESHCPCRIHREQGLICPHVTATGFWLVDATEDPVIERRKRIARRREKEPRPQGGIQRLAPDTEGAFPARLRLRLSDRWREEWKEGQISLAVQVLYNDDKFRLDKVSPKIPLWFSEQETHLLYVLEDIAGTPDSPGQLSISREQFLEVLRELAPGTFAVLNDPTPLTVSDDPHLPLLTLTLNPDTGTLNLTQTLDEPHTEYLFGRKAGWVLSNDIIRPLDAVLPRALRGAGAPEGLLIPRENALSFLRGELPRLEEQFLVDTDVSDTVFTFEDTVPDFIVELTGVPERLETRLWAVYGESRVRADLGDQAACDSFPVPGKPLAFFKRNIAEEHARTAKLGAHLAPLIEGAEAVMKVLADTAPALRRVGWRVEIGGLLEQVTEGSGWVRPVVTLLPAKAKGWFEASISYTDDQGLPLDTESVEDALARDGSTLHADDRLLLIDTSVFETLEDVRAECFKEGVNRVSDVFAGSMSRRLQEHEEISINADTDWWTRAKQQTEKVNLEPVALAEGLSNILRPYQQQGVNWLRFLEKGGYAGILADEMGLGKTLQTLAWIQLERVSESARNLPALVVCPTSLVDNWAREAARFTPDLSCRVVYGPDRHQHWDTLPDHDLIITSYALLRRDVDRYRTLQFSAAILDEAQHIKNRSTQNAQAAKHIQAFHRLVLTGTPMELWHLDTG